MFYFRNIIKDALNQRILFLGTSMILFFCIPCLSQSEQIEWSDGIYELNEKMRRKCGLFREFRDGFDKALLLKSSDSSYFVKIFRSFDDQSYQVRIDISPEELSDIQYTVDKQLVFINEYDKTMDSLSGNTMLVIANGIHGLAYGALLAFATREFSYTEVVTPTGNPFIPTMVTVERVSNLNFMHYALGTMTPLVNGGVVYLANRDRNVRPADVNMFINGASLGYLNGLSLLSTTKNNRIFDRTRANRVEYLSLLGTSLLQGWLSYHISKGYNFTYTQSVAFNTGSIMGMGSSYMLMLAARELSDMNASSAVGIYTVAGSVTGGIITNAIHKKRPRSTGDYRFINSMALIGGGLGFVSLEEVGIFESYLSSGLGAICGLSVGYASTKYTKFTSRQGHFNLLGGVLGGGLLGLGVGELFGFRADYVIRHATFGALAGWVTTYFLSKEKRNRTHRDSPMTGFWSSSAQFQFNPAGLVFLNNSHERQTRMMQHNIYPSLLTLNVKL